MDRAYRLFLVGILGWLGGCGGGGGTQADSGTGTMDASGSCGQVEPCGGALGGTWNFTGECVSIYSLQPDAKALCAQATISAVKASASGSVSFNSGMTYSISEMVAAAISWDVPLSCANGTTCAEFGSTIQQSLPAGETFNCTGTSACTCTETATSDTVDTGTYSTAASNLALTSASGSGSINGGYCVQGSTLHLITVDTTMNMGPMGQATIDKDITAQKQ